MVLLWGEGGGLRLLGAETFPADGWQRIAPAMHILKPNHGNINGYCSVPATPISGRDGRALQGREGSIWPTCYNFSMCERGRLYSKESSNDEFPDAAGGDAADKIIKGLGFGDKGTLQNT